MYDPNAVLVCGMGRIADLATLPSPVRGTANRFEETPPPRSEQHRVAMAASGRIEDGGRSGSTWYTLAADQPRFAKLLVSDVVCEMLDAATEAVRIAVYGRRSAAVQPIPGASSRRHPLEPRSGFAR